MKTLITLGVVCFSVLVSSACLAEEQTITLNDGSTLKAEIISLTDGVYTVQNNALGQITINADRITGITNQNNPAPVNIPPTAAAVAAPEINQQITQVQQQIMSNPDLMADITQLVSDPQVTQMLSDPALIQSITTKDSNGIISNPNVQQLMENPKMKDLIEKLQKQ